MMNDDDENGAIEGGMIFGNDIPPALRDQLDKLMERMKSKMGGGFGDAEACHAGTCDCQQVAKLSGDALLSFKTNRANQGKLKRKAELLISELDLLKAKVDRLRAELWEGIYESTGLPSTGDYHFCDDGRIMKRKRGESC